MIYYEDIGNTVTHRKISTNTQIPTKGDWRRLWLTLFPLQELLLSHISRLLCGRSFLCRSSLALGRSSFSFRRSLSLGLCLALLGFPFRGCWLGLQMFRVSFDSQRCLRTEHSGAFTERTCRSNCTKYGVSNSSKAALWEKENNHTQSHRVLSLLSGVLLGGLNLVCSLYQQLFYVSIYAHLAKFHNTCTPHKMYFHV